jgi:hypothetical protein
MTSNGRIDRDTQRSGPIQAITRPRIASPVRSAIRDIHRLSLTILTVEAENDPVRKDPDSLISL